MSLHISAKEGDIAEVVLLPGDPLRAKFIADTFLENAFCYNQLRNMFGYTGTYKGTRVSVQGTGMGIPSLSIYTHELIRDYGAKKLIRVGTCGALREDIDISDLILAMSASTDSSFNRLTFGNLDFAPTADFELLDKAYHIALEQAIKVKVGNVISTDLFYSDDPDRYQPWIDHGVLAAEMESAALYAMAAKDNVKALSILTVSDNLINHKAMPPEDRDKKVEDMARVALEAAIKQ
ncbi:MAG: purine-nucleoside phosphorylase [Bacteroidota bacterium]